jgi:Hpt domain
MRTHPTRRRRSREPRFAAHALKGSLGSLAALEAYDAAGGLETIARDGDLLSAARGYATLEEALGRLEPELISVSSGQGVKRP